MKKTIIFRNTANGQFRAIELNNIFEFNSYYCHEKNLFLLQFLKEHSFVEDCNSSTRLPYIGEDRIRLVLDALGCLNKHASTFLELEEIVFNDLEHLFALIDNDKFLKRFSDYLFKRYFTKFYSRYGNIVVLISNQTDIHYIPSNFRKINIGADRRFIYSCLNYHELKHLVKAIPDKRRSALSRV